MKNRPGRKKCNEEEQEEKKNHCIGSPRTKNSQEVSQPLFIPIKSCMTRQRQKNRIGKLPSAACNSRLGSESATKDARYSLCLQCHRVYLLCYPYFSLKNMASHCKCMPLRFVFSIFCFDKIKCLIVLT